MTTRPENPSGKRRKLQWIREYAEANLFIPDAPPPRPEKNRNLSKFWDRMTPDERKAYSAKIRANRTTHKLTADEKAKIGRPRQGNKVGLPIGWKRSEYEALLELKQPLIEDLMDKITSAPDFPTFDLPSDEEMAKQALQFHLTTVIMPGPVKDKQKSADSILKYTKSKPAEKHDHTINPAEAFLMALIAKDDAAD